jgi:hypothetical protein
MVTIFSANSAKIFSCEFCNITCSRKNDWNRHILTNKHNGNKNGNRNSAINIFTCKFCSKEYNSRKGLWCHNKTCNDDIGIESIGAANPEPTQTVIEYLMKENTEMKNIVLEVVKSNADLQKQMVELCKSTSITNNNHITNNTK